MSVATLEKPGVTGQEFENDNISNLLTTGTTGETNQDNFRFGNTPDNDEAPGDGAEAPGDGDKGGEDGEDPGNGEADPDPE